MKQIYFIRHGETLKNRGRVHQGPEEPLTELGYQQVREVIALLQEKNIDTLISSNYLRARETADVIGKELELPYSIEPSVREFGRPLTLYGKHHFSFSSLKYIFDLYRNRMNLLWDTEGAENLSHVRERIRDARYMLESQKGTRIAVISHRIFMSMFTETVCYDKPLSLFKFIGGFIGKNQIPNTGVLYFTCSTADSHKTCNWFLEEVILPRASLKTLRDSKAAKM